MNLPPRPLEGLCDGQMSWRSPETVAQAPQMLVLIAAAEARKAARPT